MSGDGDLVGIELASDEPSPVKVLAGGAAEVVVFSKHAISRVTYDGVVVRSIPLPLRQDGVSPVLFWDAARGVDGRVAAVLVDESVSPQDVRLCLVDDTDTVSWSGCATLSFVFLPQIVAMADGTYRVLAKRFQSADVDVVIADASAIPTGMVTMTASRAVNSMSVAALGLRLVLCPETVRDDGCVRSWRAMVFDEAYMLVGDRDLLAERSRGEGICDAVSAGGAAWLVHAASCLLAPCPNVVDAAVQRAGLSVVDGSGSLIMSMVLPVPHEGSRDAIWDGERLVLAAATSLRTMTILTVDAGGETATAKLTWPDSITVAEPRLFVVAENDYIMVYGSTTAGIGAMRMLRLNLDPM